MSIKNLLVALFHLFILLHPNSVYALQEGDIAPDLKEPSPIKLNLEKLNGKLVYLDFWASWCAPCQKSLPWMNSLQKKFPQLKIIAVNLDTKKEDAEKFIKKVNPEYEIILDPEGKIAQLYDLKAMPSSFLINGEGKIIESYTSFTKNTESEIEKAIEAYSSTPSNSSLSAS